MADDYRGYKVPKAADGPGDKAAGPKGGNSDIIMKNPPPAGKRPGHSGATTNPHFAREWDSEADLRTLLAANKIRANAARRGAALAAGKAKLPNVPAAASGAPERRANVQISDVSGAPNGGERRKGLTGLRGSGTQSNNRYDNVKPATKPNTGAKSDGGAGRW